MTLTLATLLRRIIPRYTSIASGPPTDIQLGEIATNFVTRRIYAKGPTQTLEFLDSAAIEALVGGATGIQGPPGPPGPPGTPAPQVTEFDYYGSTLPTNAASGETWRELDGNGRWVADWIVEQSEWISLTPSSERVTVLATSTTTINIPAPPENSGGSAFRIWVRLTPTAASGVWAVAVESVATPVAAGVTFSALLDFQNVAAAALIGDSDWLLLTTPPAWIRLQTTRPSGAGGLNGSVTVDWRKIRD
jgi:hypothetical protein